MAEDILDGKYGTNVANLFDADGVDANGFFTWTNVVNLDVTPANKNGSFNDPDYPDFNFPGIPGNPSTINANEHFACEFFTALEFTTAGEYTMVVNSDDDFRTTTGLNPMDTFSALTVGRI